METPRASTDTSNFLTAGNRWMETSPLSLLDVNSWTLMNQGALVVVLDMSLAVSSIFFNIMVITAIKKEEELLGKTFNLVLVNLCSANLLGAVLVKSISIVHNGYAVAAHVLETDVAFCLLYTFSYRLTWAVMPWSLVLCCWLSLLPRARRLQAALVARTSCQYHTSLAAGQGYNSWPQHGSTSASLVGLVQDSRPSQEQYASDGPSIRDKCIIGSIWFVSFIFSVLTEQILSKSSNVPCSVNDDIGTGFGSASIMIAIILPVLLGPFAVTIIHIIIYVVNCFLPDRALSKDVRNEEIGNSFCLFLLTLVFLSTYISSMILCEIFLPLPKSLLYFVIVKYIVGTSHQLLCPLCILLSRRDIRLNAGLVYRKGGTTQSKSMELTYEEIQKQLGLGVDPN